MTYAELVISHGASAYWRLDETSGLVAVDSVGSADGTISGGVSLNQSGALVAAGNTAMVFDGTSGRIATTVPVASVVPYTLEAWIRTSVSTGERAYFTSLDGVVAYGAISNGKVFSYWLADGLTGTRVISDGQWHHVVIVFSAAAVVFYVDGAQDKTYPNPVLSALNQVVEIGYRTAAGPSQAWLGSLDEVAIYPLALTANQIQQHYDAGIGLVKNPQLISIGPVIPITQNVVYAIPGIPVKIESPGVIQSSILPTGPFTNISNGLMNGCFILSPGGNTTVKLTKHIFGASEQYTEMIRSDGASAYWKLDETSGLTARDSVGSAHGTISGGVTLGEVGVVSGAMRFDGVNDYVALPTLALSSAFTLETWLKTTDPAAGNAVFLRVAEVMIYITSSGQLQIDMSGHTPSNFQIITQPVNLGAWRHIIVTHDGATVRGYLDGVLSTTTPQPRVVGSAAVGVIGATIGGGIPYLGTLDEVAIYPVALTPTQIAAHYALGIG